ncbi:DUF3014 domain-containing protein [Shewanella intestini]|uniref:DUF3014 domain-containing protein n=1 Tax=Shewanella intestini TaxID=2017544 RepID=A0ABS5I2J5_9GAMM|nr:MULTISPECIES: DUF3014 domain-containing protein [Shewanella]MBR9728106.1 DUF3014 domain-containing protein [Shewanella intestini]MRG36577.1 DUF3014 domain-containing protein [Shewanella sp. XMDDZSB0408]
MQANQDDRATPVPSSNTGNNLALIIAAIVIALIAAYFYFANKLDSQPQPIEIAPVQLPAMAPEKPIEQQPIEEVIPEQPDVDVAPVIPATEPETAQSTPEPLPLLNASDDYLVQKTTAVADGMDIQPLVIKKDIARQFVVFVDNLAQGELIRKASPLKAPERQFVVSDVTNKTYLNPDGYRRYDIYANFISELSPKALVATYEQTKPLFKEAFEELGYGNSINFDERMQQAFSQILNAPIIEDPIELSTISVNYQFVDPQLEALPNAQKLMIRMGPENTKKIQHAIRVLRQQMPNN